MNISKFIEHVDKRARVWHENVRKIRKIKLTTIKNDIGRTFRDEFKYTKDLVHNIIPVEVEIEDGFLEKLPIKIKPKKYVVDTLKGDFKDSDAELTNDVDDHVELAKPLDHEDAM
jgi:hypothetical protein